MGNKKKHENVEDILVERLFSVGASILLGAAEAMFARNIFKIRKSVMVTGVGASLIEITDGEKVEYLNCVQGNMHNLKLLVEAMKTEKRVDLVLKYWVSDCAEGPKIIKSEICEVSFTKN